MKLLVITTTYVRVYNQICDCHSDVHEEIESTHTEARGPFSSIADAEAALPGVIEMHEGMSGSAPSDFPYDPTGCSDPEYVTETRYEGRALTLTAPDDF